MFLKLTLTIAVVLSLLGLGVIKHQQDSTWADRNSLKAVASRSRADGRKTVTIPGPVVDYPGENISLDVAIRDYSVVVAELVENRSYAFGANAIRTWYRFRIVESLSQKPASACLTCPAVPEAPPEYKTINSDEFLMATSGGTVEVDGIALTVENSALPAFQNHKKYLMFISMTPSQVALLAAGPSGIFRVSDDDSLEAVNNSNRQLKEQISQRFHSKLTNLKSHLYR